MGYDPGKTAGELCLTGERVEDFVRFFPFREPTQWHEIKEILSEYEVVFCCIERITGRLVHAQTRAMMLKCLCIELKIACAEVAPVRWQKAMLGEYLNYKAPSGASLHARHKAKKERSVLVCNSRYPFLGLRASEHDMADALLLCRYGKKQWEEL